MNLSWLKLSYAYFILAALLGFFMRLQLAGFAVLPYDHLLHTHSHIAFLGWVYSSLFVLLLDNFVDKKTIKKLHFITQLKITHAMLLAILVTFMLQGYDLLSIIASSLFQLLTYWFIFSFLKALKKNKSHPTVAMIFLKIALGSLLLSSLGPWLLPVIKLQQRSRARSLICD